MVQGALYSCVANSSGKQKGRERVSCHDPWHCWQRDGCQRDALPRLPEQAGASISSLSQRSQVGWGRPLSQPCLGAVVVRQRHPAQAAPAALHPSAPKGCSDTSCQHTGLRWGQAALSLAPWHSSQDSRGTGSSRCAWKHRHGHTPGPGMSTGPAACRALPQPQCTPRAQAGQGWLCQAGAAVGAHSSRVPPGSQGLSQHSPVS